MYTLEQLQHKTFKELKGIGWQLDVLPAGDKRCRQNWIEAIVGVQPPLEASPVVEIEPAQEATEPIAPADKKFPGVNFNPIEEQLNEPLAEPSPLPLDCPSCGAVRGLFTTKDYFDRFLIRCLYCDHGRFKKYPGAIRLSARETIEQATQNFPGIKFDRAASTALRAKIFELVPEMPDPNFYQSTTFYDALSIYYDRYPCSRYRDGKYKVNTKIFLGLHIKASRAIETPPAVSFDDPEEFRQTHTAEIESYFESFTEGDRPPNCGDNGRDRLETEAKVSQSTIALADNLTPGEAHGNRTDTHRFTGVRADAHHSVCTAAKLHGGSLRIKSSALQHEESDRVLEKSRDSQASQRRALLHQPTELAAIFNDEQPSNRGDGRGRRAQQTPVTFSERFLAAYEPYFGEARYKVEATGQLNLLLEPETEDEPPDPDDFESIDAFRDAMADWDAENPESLTASMSSMCEWAPCSDDWYEPDTLEPSEVLEVSIAGECSSTCEFLIPVFDAWCDRQNDTDEPPDSGIFARRPPPKPPSFGPMSVVAGDRSSIKKFARCATLSSGRAPPGGDAH